MCSIKSYWWLLVTPFGALLWMFNTGAELAKKGHLAAEDCASCHLASDDINQKNAYLLVSSQEAICQGCHANSIQNSHPSGRKPDFKIPDEFPLDWKQELTCSSCHWIHRQPGHMNRSELLAKAYCLACHEEAFFERMLDGGTSVIGFAHIQADGAGAESGFLDDVSIQCMGCHAKFDGKLNIVLAERGIVRHSGSGSHPIGAQYESFARLSDYRPRIMLNKKMQFPDGKIACTSCHISYGEKHGDLVMSNAGSALCVECHDI